MPRPKRPTTSEPVQLTTVIHFLLDRSGSMGIIRQHVVDGFNEWLNGLKADQKKNPLNTLLLSFSQFDSNMSQHLSLEKVHTLKPISEVDPLTLETYEPRGGTPLLDAMGASIRETRDSLKQLGDKKVAVLFMTMTDGYENSSHEESRESIQKLIKECEDAGNWTFAYMGANQDSFAEVSRFGTRSTISNAANWNATEHGVKQMTRLATMSTSAYMTAVYGSAGCNDPLQQVNFFAHDPKSGETVDITHVADVKIPDAVRDPDAKIPLKDILSQKRSRPSPRRKVANF